MVRATRFTAPAAVDAWDNWFRWRDADRLHDRTIDATWWRVANAIVSANLEGQHWARRYADAFSRWQLLPDERLLRIAGTATGLASIASPCAVLNVSAFVIAPRTRQARFDDERFAHVAGLAVRMLDDALVAMNGALSDAAELRIGLIGFADALHALGIDYAGARAVEHADLIGNTLACGTMQGALELIDERGPLGPASACQLATWQGRRVADAQRDAAARNGVRHSRLTTIDPQVRLSLLANHASDALDPRPETATGTTVAAQTAIRAAIQPWIDAPIAYPLATADAPDAKAPGSLAGADQDPSPGTTSTGPEDEKR